MKPQHRTRHNQEFHTTLQQEKQEKNPPARKETVGNNRNQLTEAEEKVRHLPRKDKNPLVFILGDS
jgi:hypothetical protein